MVQEETRKGPWTEHEDLQLVGFVGLFGDRRWDFIAKVSGLNRTGKSCRLRWVNYLHPGLKRGKMTPHEERLVVELHTKWGNRWSRIARKLPGRTDNEIKNYWRTHMRKKAQERKQAVSPSSSSSNCSSSPSTDPKGNSLPFPETGEVRFYDSGGPVIPTSTRRKSEKEAQSEKVYSMDDLWKDIDLSEESSMKSIHDGYSEEDCSFTCPPMASPALEYSPDWPWRMDEEESKVFFPISNQFSFYHENGRASVTG